MPPTTIKTIVKIQTMVITTEIMVIISSVLISSANKVTNPAPTSNASKAINLARINHVSRMISCRMATFRKTK